jgi:hypothetical protein
MAGGYGKRTFKTAEDLEAAWSEYKDYCDNYTVRTHEFSQKNAEFVTTELKKSISYTIEGFCVYVKLARKAFYDTYASSARYSHIVERMREECETDVRIKFEAGHIPHQLSALWMSKFGYSTKSENRQEVVEPVKLILERGNANGTD